MAQRWKHEQSFSGSEDLVFGAWKGAQADTVVKLTDENDYYDGGRGSDHVLGLGGDDRLDGGGGPDTLSGGSGDDEVRGERGGDVLHGGSGDDMIDGAEGGDALYGGSGDDMLNGGYGADLLWGGDGKDIMYCSDAHPSDDDLAHDTVVFRSTTESTPEERDIVRQFDSSRDLIDLHAIDANVTTEAKDTFHFIGDSAFTATAGELRVVEDGTTAILQGDVNGDGQADLEVEISLNSGSHLHLNDFIL